MALKNEGKTVRIMKHGSSVNKLSFTDGPGKSIQFLDISNLLPPGTSLSGLANMTGLKQSKLYFPFAMWTSKEFLERDSLPTDPKSWFDPLLNDIVPLHEQERAHADFKRLNCKTIFQYLTIYLRIDVLLLGMGGLVFLNSMRDLFVDVHSIDVGKYTLSGYSQFVIQKVVMMDKRVGMWSPTHPIIYGLIKQSCIGGLVRTMHPYQLHPTNYNSFFQCCVFKHACDYATLSERGKKLADSADGPSCVNYQDISSLYGKVCSLQTRGLRAFAFPFFCQGGRAQARGKQNKTFICRQFRESCHLGWLTL